MFRKRAAHKLHWYLKEIRGDEELVDVFFRQNTANSPVWDFPEDSSAMQRGAHAKRRSYSENKNRTPEADERRGPPSVVMLTMAPLQHRFSGLAFLE